MHGKINFLREKYTTTNYFIMVFTPIDLTYNSTNYTASQVFHMALDFYFDPQSVRDNEDFFNDPGVKSAVNISSPYIDIGQNLRVVHLQYSSYFTTASNYDAISDWDVSNVTDMSSAFYYNRTSSSSQYYDTRGAFSRSLNNWDVSNVTNMYRMFENCQRYNNLMTNWNTSKVNNMANMFKNAYTFNTNIDSWDVSNVTAMNSMFHNATSFNNQENTFASWDVRHVRNMSSMFRCENKSFSADYDYSSSSTSNHSFNQDISSWDVSAVTDMSNMFLGTSDKKNIFNQDIHIWRPINVTNFNNMFQYTLNFNKNVSLWYPDSNATFTNMFLNADANTFPDSPVHSFFSKSFTPANNADFNTAIAYYFGDAGDYTSFLASYDSTAVGQLSNSDTKLHISVWDTSNVTDMSSAFSGRSSFAENVELKWDV